MPRRPSKATLFSRAGFAFAQLLKGAYDPLPDGWRECKHCHGLADAKRSAHIAGCPMLGAESAYKAAWGYSPARVETQVIFFRPEDRDILKRNPAFPEDPPDHPACRCAQPGADGAWE
jgi:hypothetical protein